MILLDTHVMSEPLRRAPEPRAIAWIDAQPMETLFLSAITVADLRAGVALLPAGKRRAGLQENLEKRVLPLFAGRVLPFDLACTQAYAALMAKARALGMAIPRRTATSPPSQRPMGLPLPPGTPVPSRRWEQPVSTRGRGSRLAVQAALPRRLTSLRPSLVGGAQRQRHADARDPEAPNEAAHAGRTFRG